MKIDIPSACPIDDCDDQVLTKTEGLRYLFKRYNDALDVDDIVASGMAELEICLAIRAQRSRIDSINHARTVGWPININFRGLPDRVVKMKDQIYQLLFVEGLKSKDVFLVRFLHVLKEKGYSTRDSYKKLHDPMKVPKDLITDARPG
jgi:hypothetical protein